MPLNTTAECRDELLSYFKAQFVGPILGEQEVLPFGVSVPPVVHYLTGVLYPQIPEINVVPPGGEPDLTPSAKHQGKGEDAGDSDANSAIQSSRHQSSCGVTFHVPTDMQGLIVKGSFGRYQLRQQAGGGQEWVRTPFIINVNVCLNAEPDQMLGRDAGMPEGVSLRVLARPPELGARTVTVTLINDAHLDTTEYVRLSHASLFQVSFGVQAVGGRFLERPLKDLAGMDEDRREALLLHLHSKEYAIGHGCAATWAPGQQSPELIRAEFLPHADVLPLEAPEDRTSPLIVRYFAQADGQGAATDDASTLALLEEIPQRYAQWVEQIAATRLALVPDDFKLDANRQLARCRRSCERIMAGIQELRTKPQAMLAFRMANSAMVEVLRRSDWERKHGAGGRVYDPAFAKPVDECKWRPFQLAFVLQCLTSITKPESEDRKVCDLLWFPTGGGKTEAYLLLTAFVLFYRRLVHVNNPREAGGVAVMMRYTLRLLTVDQFVRASRMICAAEVIRRRHPLLQNSPEISIGMFVGGDATPNIYSKARIALGALIQTGVHNDGGSPCKFTACPWCNHEVNYQHYSADDANCRIVLACPSVGCDFRGGLPQHVVDDDVYETRPSLIIGTVDKFAQLAYRDDAGRLFGTFGIGGKPDLIIQDELHLISGPLGTIAGLYETAIDRLCERRDGTRPKVIASTATIRNAHKQVANLFAREVVQFPQPLLDSRDSFFAREVTGADAVSRSRRYVGLFASGKTASTVMIKAAGTLSQGVHEHDATPQAKDPYWTMLGYFGSLRELGGALFRVQDDTRQLVGALGALPGSRGARAGSTPLELTSRVDEQDLITTRSKLGVTLTTGQPLDVVLCSNMISVGLDIPRLSLMFMLGQPKTTAEYIQASSRVGRMHPGLVFMLYSSSRSRDRSFYEHFQRYHGSFYAEVEATSVTPFASRARERALHAALVILCRHTIAGMAQDVGAAGIRANLTEARLIADYLVGRLSAQDPSEAEDIRKHMENILERWQTKSSAYAAGLCYSKNQDQNGNLLIDFDEVNPDLGAPPDVFPTMNQMRNVDPMCGITVLP